MENIYSNKVKRFSFDGIAPYLYSTGIFLTILLWSYAVFSKLEDLKLYQRQMNEQPFSPEIIYVLIYLVPALELAAATLLILNRYKWGLRISLSLLVCFTIYISIILNKVFLNAPCSCGGFISKLSWKNHLYFNMLFIVLNTFCLIHANKKERRSTANS